MKHLCAVVLPIFAASVAWAAPRVVADEACPHYAIDIASFATCDGNVVASETAPAIVPPTEQAVEPVAAPAPMQVSRSDRKIEVTDRKRKARVPTS